MMFESKVKMFLVEIGMEGVFSYMSMKNGLNLKHKRTKTLKCYLLILNNTIQPKYNSLTGVQVTGRKC